jgi:signal peptidase I
MIIIKGFLFISLVVSCQKELPEPEPEPEITEEETPEVIAMNAYYVAPAPKGNDRNPGTKEKPWATWNKAFNSRAVGPGDTVYFREGVYEHTGLTSGKGYDCTRNGQPDHWVYYFNYPNETPILDCDGIRASGTKNYPLYMRYLSYVHFKGLKVRNVWQADGEDEITAWSIGRSHDVIVENCATYNTHGAGFLAQFSHEVYYINCDAYNHCDSLTSVPASNPMPGNDGTGFLDHNSTATDTRIYYKNCRAWNCGDQGFSSGSIGYSEYDGCWSFQNGQLEGGGHGFKMGWVSVIDPTIVNRLYKHCIAAYNRRYGFDSNDQGYYAGALHLFNNTSYNNGYRESGKVAAGFYVYNTLDTDERELRRELKNNISYANKNGDILVGDNGLYTHEHNSWDSPPGLSISDASFLSVDSSGLTGPRQEDGSLPDMDFLKLAPGSAAINAGTASTGLSYKGSSPDLGAYEY